MTVIAFRPRTAADPVAAARADLAGTFRSPRGRMGRMEGSLRVHRVVIVPRGVFVTGVFTGELRDDDGSVVGVDSRRLTAAADLVREGSGFVPVVRPFQLDLMGLTVELEETRIAPSITLPVPPCEVFSRPGRPKHPGRLSVVHP